MASVGSCRSSDGGRAKEDLVDHPPHMIVKSVGFCDMSTRCDGHTLVDKVDGPKGGEYGQRNGNEVQFNRVKEDPIEYGKVTNEVGPYIDEIDELLSRSHPTCLTPKELLRIEKYKIEFGSEPLVEVTFITWVDYQKHIFLMLFQHAMLMRCEVVYLF